MSSLTLKLLHTLAKESASKIVGVGAVLIKDGKILIAANNRSLITNQPMERETKLVGTYAGEPWAAHAEETCIAWAASVGVVTAGTSMYITLSPCYVCARLIVAAGISSIFYEHLWWDKAALTFLQYSGVQCHKLTRERKDNHEQGQDSPLHKEKVAGTEPPSNP